MLFAITLQTCVTAPEAAFEAAGIEIGFDYPCGAAYQQLSVILSLGLTNETTLDFQGTIKLDDDKEAEFYFTCANVSLEMKDKCKQYFNTVVANQAATLIVVNQTVPVTIIYQGIKPGQCFGDVDVEVEHQKVKVSFDAYCDAKKTPVQVAVKFSQPAELSGSVFNGTCVLDAEQECELTLSCSDLFPSVEGCTNVLNRDGTATATVTLKGSTAESAFEGILYPTMEKGLTSGQITGIVIGVIVGILVLIGIVVGVFCCIRNKKASPYAATLQPHEPEIM